jgi:hypothetical protein
VRALTHEHSVDNSHLHYALRRHASLVVEDATEVFTIGKHIGLARQVSATRIDQIYTWQTILFGDLLRSQMLAHSYRIVRAACQVAIKTNARAHTLNGGIISDNDALTSGNTADPRDYATGWHCLVLVQLMSGQLAELKKRSAGVKHGVDTLTRQ